MHAGCPRYTDHQARNKHTGSEDMHLQQPGEPCGSLTPPRVVDSHNMHRVADRLSTTHRATGMHAGCPRCTDHQASNKHNGSEDMHLQQPGDLCGSIAPQPTATARLMDAIKTQQLKEFNILTRWPIPLRWLWLLLTLDIALFAGIRLPSALGKATSLRRSVF